MTEKILITDFNDTNTSIYNMRSETALFRMNEPKPGIFIAETELVIRRALNAGFTPISMLCAKSELDSLESLINECENAFDDSVFPVYYAEHEHIKNLIGFPLTRGVLCAMKRRILPLADQVIENAKNIAILCDIENPTNIGTIFRNAAALNIDAIILYGNCSDPLYRRSLRAGMGCQFSIPWTICKDLNEIKEKGFLFAALALRDDSISLLELAEKKNTKKAVILGNEGYGLSEEILDLCDEVITIPMREGVDSLNVAVASGIAFYELSKN